MFADIKSPNTTTCTSIYWTTSRTTRYTAHAADLLCICCL